LVGAAATSGLEEGDNVQRISLKGERKMDDHKAEEMKGRLKEALGDLKGDKELQRDGKRDQLSAATKEKIDDVGEKLKDVVDP